MRESTRESERARIEKSFEVFGLSAEDKALIVEALDSEKWDWFEDCDGCTSVSEVFWPTKYFPPCVRHDFDCAMGKNGLDASKRFFRLQMAYGMGAVRAGWRAAGVTVAWYCWLKWWK